MTEQKKKALRLDLAGMLVSGLCALHCSVIPVILVLGLGSGLGWMMSHGVELFFFIASFILASWSLFNGYHKVHGRKSVLIIALLGFLAFLIGHGVDHFLLKVSMTSLGGLSILVAHFLNFRYQSRSLTTKVA